MKTFAGVVLFLIVISIILSFIDRFLESEGIPTEDSTDYYDRE